jgi:hypothetical protein
MVVEKTARRLCNVPSLIRRLLNLRGQALPQKLQNNCLDAALCFSFPRFPSNKYIACQKLVVLKYLLPNGHRVPRGVVVSHILTGEERPTRCVRASGFKIHGVPASD